jgi:hypothetical protein
MRQAYVDKENRGSWGGGSSSDYRYRGGSDQGTDIINRYGGPGLA